MNLPLWLVSPELVILSNNIRYINTVTRIVGLNDGTTLCVKKETADAFHALFSSTDEPKRRVAR